MATVVRIRKSGAVLAVVWDDDLGTPPRGLGFDPADLEIAIVARDSFTEAGRTYDPPAVVTEPAEARPTLEDRVAALEARANRAAAAEVAGDAAKLRDALKPA